MKAWNKVILEGSIKGAITKKEKEIRNLSNLRSEEEFTKRSQVESDLEKLLEEEESYWKLRSREDWLKEGD